ncbi:MAG TPA: HD domain-containing protein [Candidatus Saccharimonadia bacterium]|nr:HD domain-containing protein [Candidatus Saccharimonadia bacterium]
MNHTPELLSQLQQLVAGVSNIERHHYHPGTDQHENVAEHSLSVATLSWFLHQHVASTTNLDLVLKYAIIHDFVEIYADDVHTFADPKARQRKEVDEAKALGRLTSELTYFPDITTCLQDYQAMASPEARFVWSVDKIQAYILGNLDEWRPYREYPVSLEQFQAKQAEHLEQCTPELQPIFRDLIAYTLKTY